MAHFTSALRGALRRRLRYPLEGAAAWLAFALCRRLPLDLASRMGGWLGRAVGPRLARSRRAEARLRRAMPELSEAEAERVIRAMWDNLGRVVAEYPHLEEFAERGADDRVELVGAEHVERAAKDGVGAIFFSAHLGNWEILSPRAARHGVPLTQVYRAANNPFIERLTARARRGSPGLYLPKGPGTARGLFEALQGGAHLAMLVDQKLNEGIPVPFFGRDAMTAPLIAQLGLRFACPVLPARVERLEGARFRITVLEPLELSASGDREADVRACMGRINALIESWVRARPEQWLWLHRRWPE
ncbi:MAG: lauroyl acyltransferase [Alphaproteobacteria bacterium]